MYLLGLATLCAMAIPFHGRASETVAGQVDFGPFNPPSGGGEYVEVHLSDNLLAMAARLVGREEPDLEELIRGLRGIRVHVVGLNNQNREEITRRIERVRSGLAAEGWERVVSVQSGQEDVGVHLKTRGEEAIEGLVVTVIEGGGRAVFVNVVGELRPERLAELGERLGIAPLKEIGRKLHRHAEPAGK